MNKIALCLILFTLYFLGNAVPQNCNTGSQGFGATTLENDEVNTLFKSKKSGGSNLGRTPSHKPSHKSEHKASFSNPFKSHKKNNSGSNPFHAKKVKKDFFKDVAKNFKRKKKSFSDKVKRRFNKLNSEGKKILKKFGRKGKKKFPKHKGRGSLIHKNKVSRYHGSYTHYNKVVGASSNPPGQEDNERSGNNSNNDDSDNNGKGNKIPKRDAEEENEEKDNSGVVQNPNEENRKVPEPKKDDKNQMVNLPKLGNVPQQLIDEYENGDILKDQQAQKEIEERFGAHKTTGGKFVFVELTKDQTDKCLGNFFFCNVDCATTFDIPCKVKDAKIYSVFVPREQHVEICVKPRIRNPIKEMVEKTEYREECLLRPCACQTYETWFKVEYKNDYEEGMKMLQKQCVDWCNSGHKPAGVIDHTQAVVTIERNKNKLKEGFSKVTQAIADFIDKGKILIDKVSGAVKWVGIAIGKGLAEAGKGIENGAKFVGKGIVNGAKFVAKNVVEGAKKIGKVIGVGAKKIFEGAKKVGQTIGKGAKAVFNGAKVVGKKIGEGAKKVGQAIGKGAKKVGQTIGKGAKAVFNGAKNVGKKIGGAFKAFGGGAKKTISKIGNGFKKIGGGAVRKVGAVAKNVGRKIGGAFRRVGSSIRRFFRRW